MNLFVTIPFGDKMKLFVTDYDGTLFIDEINLNINRKKLLELHKLGYIIVISTGRSFESIKKQVEKYNIYYDYLNCADGASIYDKNDNLLAFFEMKHDIVKEILKLKDKTKYEEIQICYPDCYKDTYNELDKIAGINIVLKSTYKDNSFINEFLNLEKKYPNYNFLIYDHGTYIYFCVKLKGVCKAYAVNYMKNLLNVKQENIYVIGDSFNDLEMIKEYNGVSIVGNLELNKCSKKTYHHVYEYIDEIKD